MRKWGIAPIVIVIVGAVAVAGWSASAAEDKEIRASDNAWTPPTITVQPGEKVTWVYGGQNPHNLIVDGREVRPPGTNWEPYSASFTAGEHPFECDLHVGMTGRVIVQGGGGTPTPTPTPTRTPTPPPGATPTPGPGGSPPPGEELRIRRLAVASGAFCVQRSRRCRRPGVRLRIDLSRPATVRGTLDRRPPRGSKRFRRVGTVSFGRVAAGPRQLRFSKVRRRPLAAGSYRMRVQVGDLSRTLTFRVRAS